MKHINITIVIEEICKRLKIDYISPNHHKIIEVKKAVEELADIYLELKEIIGRLQVIEEKHEIEGGLGKKLEQDIQELNIIDHDIVKMAYKIARKKK